MHEKNVGISPRKIYTLEDKLDLYHKFQQARLTKDEFRKIHGLSNYMLNKLIQECSLTNSTSAFSPVQIKHHSTSGVNLMSLSITFNCSAIQINLDIPEHKLVSFIQEMGCATTIIR